MIIQMVNSGRLPQFRVAVNSRCGRRCFFCRPSGEAVETAPGIQIPPGDLLAVARSVRRHGINSIKLTGGDPALYQPIVQVVQALKRDLGFSHVEVISRHPRIGDLASKLAAAGADQINISLDTLDPKKHAAICGVDDLAGVLQAIESCVASKVAVKINTVVMAGVNDQEVYKLIDHCADIGVGTVKLLDVIDDLDRNGPSFSVRIPGIMSGSLRSLYIPLDAISQSLEHAAVSAAIRNQGGLGHPMTSFRLRSGIEVVIKDSRAGAWYGKICAGCPHYPCHDALMALRLTADLRLQYCLLRSDNLLSLKNLIACGDEQQLDLAVGLAVRAYSQTTFISAPPKRDTLVQIFESEPVQRRLTTI